MLNFDLWLVLTRHLIIENFIPLEEKSKIISRAAFDEEDDTWKMKPITRVQEYVNTCMPIIVQICVPQSVDCSPPVGRE